MAIPDEDKSDVTLAPEAQFPPAATDPKPPLAARPPPANRTSPGDSVEAIDSAEAIDSIQKNQDMQATEAPNDPHSDQASLGLGDVARIFAGALVKTADDLDSVVRGLLSPSS